MLIKTLTSLPSLLLIFLSKLFKYYTLFVLLWIIVYGFSSIHFPSEVQTTGSEGLGFLSLADGLGVWTSLRNIGYGLAAVLFVAHGIRLQVARFSGLGTVEYSQELKTGLQPDVAGLAQQHSLAQVSLIESVKYLLLLTFSYAIAGLGVDLVYLAYFVSLPR